MSVNIQCSGRFKISIADEAYYLKNSEAKRTENILPILQGSKRCILLAGTPALARPKEIYNLLYIIRPDIFTNFKDFGQRYCAPKPNPWSRGMDYTGAANLKELHYILTNSVMIRRLKKDVLSELPTKIRQKVQIDTDNEYIVLIQQVLNGMKGSGSSAQQNTKLAVIIRNLLRAEWAQDEEHFEENALKIEREEGVRFPQFFECYRYTGLAKLNGIRKYVKDILQNDIKVLVFAHHTEIMDAIEEEVVLMKLKYIRIDGQVPTKKRYDLVKSFQEDEEVKVAILSLTAAGLGLTLTAASKVIFAEVRQNLFSFRY